MRRLSSVLILVLVRASCIAQVVQATPHHDVAKLIRGLQTRDPESKRTALETLALLSPSDSVCNSTHDISKLLGDPSSVVKQSTTVVIIRCLSKRPDLEPIVMAHSAEIVSDLGSSDAREREALLRLVFVIRKQMPSEFQPAVEQLLDDPDPKVKRMAIYAVQHFSPASARIIGILDDLAEKKGIDAAYAETTLGELKVSDSRTISMLAANLDSNDTFVQQEAIRALWHIGPAAISAIPKLQSFAADITKNYDLRQLAGGAIHAISN